MNDQKHIKGGGKGSGSTNPYFFVVKTNTSLIQIGQGKRLEEISQKSS